MPRAGETIEEWTLGVDETVTTTSPHTIPHNPTTWKNILHAHLPITSRFTTKDVYENVKNFLG
jgi:hypothetical protein